MNELAIARRRSAWLTVLFCSVMAGCGSPASDKPASLGARSQAGGLAASGPSQGESPSGASRTSDTQTGLPKGSEATRGANTSATALTGEPDERDGTLVPGLPESIAKDLGSPDARDRLRALDHWGTEGTTAPLDPVFEAMEDEDEAVRARATAIVEQSWAAEQEREQG